MGDFPLVVKSIDVGPIANKPAMRLRLVASMARMHAVQIFLIYEDFADLTSSLLRQFGVRSFSAESQGGRAALEIKSMNSWRTHVLPHAKVKELAHFRRGATRAFLPM